MVRLADSVKELVMWDSDSECWVHANGWKVGLRYEKQCGLDKIIGELFDQKMISKDVAEHLIGAEIWVPESRK